MNPIERWLMAGRRGLRPARWLVLALALWFAATGTALAAKKKKEEAVGPPKKSYTASYLIVIMGLTVGLMTILRPGKRLDKVPERIIKEAAED
jgi:hypothetical protein